MPSADAHDTPLTAAVDAHSNASSNLSHTLSSGSPGNQACVCGNILGPEAPACRKCGATRPGPPVLSQSPPISEADSPELHEGDGFVARMKKSAQKKTRQITWKQPSERQQADEESPVEGRGRADTDARSRADTNFTIHSRGRSDTESSVQPRTRASTEFTIHSRGRSDTSASTSSDFTLRTEPTLASEGRAMLMKVQKSLQAVSHYSEAYTRKVSARWPCLCASCGLLIISLISGLGVGLLGMQVETDFDAIMKTDAVVSKQRDAFKAALSVRNTHSRRLQVANPSMHAHNSSLRYSGFNIFIVYKLKKSSRYSSILDAGVVSTIARFERSLTSLAGWIDMCGNAQSSHRSGCNPGISVVQHMFATLDHPTPRTVVPDRLKFDGQGRGQIFLPTLVHVLDHLQLSDVIFPCNFDRKTPEKITEIRSAFHFKLLCCDSSDSTTQKKRMEDLREKWKVFITSDVLPKLKAPDGDDSDELPFHLYYDGTRFEEIEVMQALNGDIVLACMSLFFVLLYMTWHTGSLLLSFTGVLVLFLALPMSYVIFAVLSGSTKMSLAMFPSLFLVVGLGSDVIFVFTDFWRNSGCMDQFDGHSDRLVYVLLHAGKATFATTATTALSFIVNLVSVLRALREFGFFMAIGILMVWLLVSLIFAPVCIVDEKWFSRCGWRLWDAVGDKSEQIKGWRAYLLGEWVQRLHPWRRGCLGVTAIFSATALIAASCVAEVDSDIPNLFPGSHNRNAGLQVLDSFTSLANKMDGTFQLPQAKLDVCQESRFQRTDRACPLFWCQTESNSGSTSGSISTSASAVPLPTVPKVADGTCKCYQTYYNRDYGQPFNCTTNGAAWYRFVGAGGVSLQQLSGLLAAHINSDGSGFRTNAGNVSNTTFAPVMLQDWETGHSMLKPMTELYARLYHNGGIGQCGYQSMCFCGSYICQLNPNRWQAAPDFVLSTARRLSQNTTQSPAIPAHSTVVDVIFGISVDTGSPLLGESNPDETWSFQQDFDLSRPWTQRNLYAFCTKLPKYLQVVSEKCVMAHFRDFLLDQRLLFPVNAKLFAPLMKQFMATNPFPAKDYLWLQGDNQVKGVQMVFTVNFDKNSAMDAAVQYKRLWDQYVDEWNFEASRGGTGAWHTSELWVRTVAQQELVSSTLLTLLLAVLLAFVSMLIFTVDILLSIYVVLAALGVISCLMFFMLVTMGWALGPVEVIALIVFIGYALDYSLHIAHKYTSIQALEEELPDATSEASAIRLARTIFALKSVGGAAVGSAVTTLGCSLFLIFCTLTIFTQLGAVVFVVTLMSIIMAFGPLTSALLVAGPLHPEQNLDRLYSFFQHSFSACLAVEQTFVQRRFEIRRTIRQMIDRTSTNKAPLGAQAQQEEESRKNKPEDHVVLDTAPPQERLAVHESPKASRFVYPTLHMEDNPVETDNAQEGSPAANKCGDCAPNEGQGTVLLTASEPTSPTEDQSWSITPSNRRPASPTDDQSWSISPSKGRLSSGGLLPGPVSDTMVRAAPVTAVKRSSEDNASRNVEDSRQSESGFIPQMNYFNADAARPLSFSRDDGAWRY